MPPVTLRKDKTKPSKSIKSTTLSVTKPSLIGKAEKVLIDKLHKVEASMNYRVLEREMETRGILLALLSETSLFFYGDVGASKTGHIRLAGGLCGLRVFDKQISETTRPFEIFGPDDIPALANEGVQRTKIQGYAADADVAFFDEAFKASGTVLDPLLRFINEREYLNGDEGLIHTPLKTTFIASNEIPTDDHLRAFFDRLLLRYEVNYIKTHSNLRKMIDLNLARKQNIEPILSRKETLSLMDMRRSVKVRDEVKDVAIKVRDQISNVFSSPISDRRFAQSFFVMQANALINGRRTCEIADVEVLGNIFWNQPEQAVKTRAIAMGHVSAEAADLYSYVEIAESVANTGIQTGNISAAITKLRSLYKKTKGFTTQGGKQVSRTILGKLQEFKGIQEQRNAFILIRVAHDKKRIYKISTAAASVWSANQLRSCGFHWKRNGGYWYFDGSRHIITRNIKQHLNVDVTIKKSTPNNEVANGHSETKC